MKVKHRNKRAIYFMRHKELSLMYLINSKRLFIPVHRAMEIEKRQYGSSELEDITMAFILKYLTPIKKFAEYVNRSAYKIINRAIYKRLIPIYQDMIFEKLLQGDSVVLPAGLGTLQIMDLSPYTQTYNIALRGQSPKLVLKIVPKKTRERMNAKGYDYLIVHEKPKFRWIVYQNIVNNHVRYPKIETYGKHEIHKPPSNTYVTGKTFQGEAI